MPATHPTKKRLQMKLKKRKKGIFHETAASSDLAFILIIYFLVIAGFNLNLGFLISLPERASSRLVQSDELLRFEMDSSGKIFFEGTALTLTEAEQKIRSAPPDLVLLLLIDPKAPWQEVVSFVELSQKLEVSSFSFNLWGRE